MVKVDIIHAKWFNQYMTRRGRSDQQRYMDGPDYEVEEMVFCQGCQEEKELTVTGFAEDAYSTAYCCDCDTANTIEKPERNVEPDDDYCW